MSEVSSGSGEMSSGEAGSGADSLSLKPSQPQCYAPKSTRKYCVAHFLTNAAGYSAAACADECSSQNSCAAYTSYSNGWCQTVADCSTEARANDQSAQTYERTKCASPPLEASSGEAGSGADSLAVKSDFWGMEKDLKRYVERENAKMDAILDRLAKLENERSESGLTTITRH